MNEEMNVYRLNNVDGNRFSAKRRYGIWKEVGSCRRFSAIHSEAGFRFWYCKDRLYAYTLPNVGVDKRTQWHGQFAKRGHTG